MDLLAYASFFLFVWVASHSRDPLSVQLLVIGKEDFSINGQMRNCSLWES